MAIDFFNKTEVKMQRQYEKGFTLIELLVAMAIALVVMAGVYSVYYSQQKSYVVQEQVVAVQQNLRAGMTLLSLDIMSAGYDPIGTFDTGLTMMGNNSLAFTRLNESGVTVETIQYGRDVINSIDVLYREFNGTRLPVAENIDWLYFDYLDDSRNPVTNPANIGNVRSIQVTMVARTGRGDPGYVDNKVYWNKQHTDSFGPQHDNLRRRVLTREIKCRNLL
jgi:type IV pilus assembly protein PilW